MKIALMGGSFDPPHSAHINMIKSLSERFEKVIVLPTRVSPFKKGAKAASGEDRVAMLNIAQLPQNVEVSRYELDREGVSYSYLTAKHYAEIYPQDELYFVIGSDGIGKLHKWANIDELAETVTFYVVERKGFPVDDKRLAKLVERGVKIDVSDLEFPDVSSTSVKVELAFRQVLKRAVEGLPKTIVDYIDAHELYTDYRAIVDRYAEFDMKRERIEHTFRATMMGIYLAKKHGANVENTVTALLLHDIGKYVTPAKLAEYGITLSDEILDMPAPIRHAAVGALIAQAAFKVRKKSIINAIASHTTGKPKMTKLEEIVFLADTVEVGRTFDGVEQLRQAACDNLKKGVEATLEHSIRHVGKDDLYPTTVDAYIYYRLRNDAKLKRAYSNGEISEADILRGVMGQSEQNDTKRTIPQEKTVKKTQSETDASTLPALVRKIVDCLSDKKARNVVALDVRAQTTIADYLVIAGAGSSTQVKALAEYVDEKLSKEDGIEPLHRDRNDKWIAVDYGSVILHVMTEETRDFYRLERLWGN